MRYDKHTVAPRWKNRSFAQDAAFKGRADSWFTENPTARFTWLDVGCGRGALLGQARNLFPSTADQIIYHGYDINIEFAHACERLALEVKVPTTVHIGELPKLREYFPDKYTAVTLVNVIHEIPLPIIPDLLLDLILSCDDTGFVFLFDVASLPYDAPEPGALPWRIEDVNSFLQVLSKAIKTPLRATSHISTQGAWYFFISRKALPPDFDKTLKTKRTQIKKLLLDGLIEVFQSRQKSIDETIRNYAYQFYQSTSEELSESRRLPSALKRIRDLIDVEIRNYWSCDCEVASLMEGKA